MTKEFKKLWCDALRSGVYEQTTHSWRSGNRFCCLGVANKISGCEVDKDGCSLDYDSIYNTTPLIGITESEASQLATMNDAGKSFNEIADYIEQNF